MGAAAGCGTNKDAVALQIAEKIDQNEDNAETSRQLALLNQSL